jgi:hypothetical protein
MLDSESPSTRYRRLAQECWETAHTFPDGERRIALLQMAQVWQRLAVDHADSTPLHRFCRSWSIWSRDRFRYSLL